ncbi:hypothetical protein RSK20926_19542 [Roseobacter sp. SK209-2-6]|uniref:GNAT family N-acetyltransferase n=1 Tax=Roseobacter sp. SK209-2-6 TaxID=388739 RepID=UPI0000F3F81B|nr:GNAT family N-acetyltransferase [Roseobacter sp. SK209-2-6]EBA17965.1 hypothetical protein RSK20926_19542 [Roseobacter sp. SK209-2-6]
MSLEILRYSPEQAENWDQFVKTSKNGTFLFQRAFMDYHADRFEDHSLMVWVGGKLLALLPANRRDRQLHSHGGLTYGGFVTGSRMGASRMLELFEALMGYLKNEGFDTLIYKPVPHIYHSQLAEEDLYALSRFGAQCQRTDLSSAIFLPDRFPFGSGKKDGLRKARKAGIQILESQDWAECWNLLTAVLDRRHGVAPVHSLDEIGRLAEAFPQNIKLFGAFEGAQMVSALVIFDCGPCVHVQYIASSDQGRAVGGVDAIVKHLVETVYSDRMWFDFGISTTDQGRSLNEGLVQQKEMFGARSTLYQQFHLEIR